MDGDTTEILSNIASVLVDRREHVYVFQRLVPYIAVFDRDGKRVATLGRSGGGPGEFALPTRIAFIRTRSGSPMPASGNGSGVIIEARVADDVMTLYQS